MIMMNMSAALDGLTVLLWSWMYIRRRDEGRAAGDRTARFGQGTIGSETKAEVDDLTHVVLHVHCWSLS